MSMAKAIMMQGTAAAFARAVDAAHPPSRDRAAQAGLPGSDPCTGRVRGRAAIPARLG